MRPSYYRTPGTSLEGYSKLNGEEGVHRHAEGRQRRIRFVTDKEWPLRHTRGLIESRKRIQNKLKSILSANVLNVAVGASLRTSNDRRSGLSGLHRILRDNLSLFRQFTSHRSRPP